MGKEKMTLEDVNKNYYERKGSLAIIMLMLKVLNMDKISVPEEVSSKIVENDALFNALCVFQDMESEKRINTMLDFISVVCSASECVMLHTELQHLIDLHMLDVQNVKLKGGNNEE